MWKLEWHMLQCPAGSLVLFLTVVSLGYLPH